MWECYRRLAVPLATRDADVQIVARLGRHRVNDRALRGPEDLHQVVPGRAHQADLPAHDRSIER
jgi:hypothetical protein